MTLRLQLCLSCEAAPRAARHQGISHMVYRTGMGRSQRSWWQSLGRSGDDLARVVQDTFGCSGIWSAQGVCQRVGKWLHRFEAFWGSSV